MQQGKPLRRTGTALALALLVGGLTLTVATASHAASLRLFSGAVDITIADGDACDFNPAIGVITFISSACGTFPPGTPIGNFDINVTTFITKPAFGSAAAPHIDLNSVNVTSSAAGTLTIRASDTDFSAGSAFVFNVGGTSGGTGTWKAYADDSNAIFGMANLLGTVTGGPGPFSGSVTGSALLTNPFSLTIEAVIVHGGAAITSFDAELRGVPEPGAISLFGLSLGLAALAGRRRQVASVV